MSNLDYLVYECNLHNKKRSWIVSVVEMAFPFYSLALYSVKAVTPATKRLRGATGPGIRTPEAIFWDVANIQTKITFHILQIYYLSALLKNSNKIVSKFLNL